MESLPARTPFALVLISVGLTTAVGVACTHGTTTAPRPASFEMREVVTTQVGRDALATHPFTTGVIGANDPYRHDPAFAEAPPDALRISRARLSQGRVLHTGTGPQVPPRPGRDHGIRRPDREGGTGPGQVDR